MDQFIAAVIAVVVALISATSAIWVDRSFASKDRQRDLFLEWLDLIDQQRVLTQRALQDPGEQSEMVLNFTSRFLSIIGRMELLASEEVRRRVVLVHETQKRLTDEAMKAGEDRPDLDTLFVELRALPERRDAIEAMRKEISTRWFRRRI
jgi:hypothetical protein